MVKVSETPGIAPAEFAERRRGAVEHATREGLRGLLVFSRGGGTLDRYADVLYLTNYYTPFPFIPDLPGNWTARAHTSFTLPVDGESTLVIDSPNDGRIALPAEQIVYTDFVLEDTIKALRKARLERGAVGVRGMVEAHACARGLEHRDPRLPVPRHVVRLRPGLGATGRMG